MSVGQIYLLDNPLLKERLRHEHVKARLIGHWGHPLPHSTDGIAAIHSQLLGMQLDPDFAEAFPTASTTRPTGSHRAAGCF